MIRPPVVLGVARAELRSIRRLARYWVFVCLASIIGLLSYLYYAGIHGFTSHFSASIGLVSPKYLFAALGFWPLVIFMAGLIFLAFDVRARDERERMAEVMDVRPMTNMELLSGRFLANLLAGWLPLVGVSLFVQLLGFLGETFGWYMGEVVEPYSLLGFVFITAIPALSFILAVVFVTSLVVRNRFVSGVGTLVVLGLALWGFYALPFYIGEPTGLAATGISEITPNLMSTPAILYRLSLIIAAVGLLVIAAGAHPRRDSAATTPRIAVGTAMVVLALANGALLIQQSRSEVARFADWKAAHEARRDEPVPSLDEVRGTIRIEPGQRLEANLELALSGGKEAQIERVLLTLNPDLVVERVTGPAGQELGFEHQNGLLEVSLDRPLAADSTARIGLEYRGRPNTRFAYLDTARDPFKLRTFETQLVILGIEPGIFHSRYVALMPGIHWLPSAGSAVGRNDPSRHHRDFFHLDLTVDLPEEWLVAGPGRGRPVSAPGSGAAGARGANRTQYRFAPEAPLPEVALLASRFEKRSFSIGEVEFAVLVDPAHTRNLDFFADAADEIRQWIEERLQQAADLGLTYPYDALTLVEVPSNLRGYGGGWRMDTVLAPPGLVLLRENSFPTSRFEFPFRNPDRFKDRDGGLARAKRESLERFFENDFIGGNVFHGAARNFFLHQTAARGSDGLPLDFVSHDLTGRLLTGKQGFFSAYLFDSQLGAMVGAMFQNLALQGGRGSVADILISTANDQPEVWDQVLEVALGDLDPWLDPGQTVKVLQLKGGALSRWIFDGLGLEKTGELLAELRSRHRGTTFDRHDLLAAGTAVGIDLEELLGDWLGETALPGFVASEANLFRLDDDQDGSPRYQLSLHLRNDESAPGLVRLRYTTDEPGRRAQWDQSEPIRVPAREAVEIGLVTSKPPRRVSVAPYISLNRREFRIALPSLSPAAEEEIVDAEPLVGSRPSDWEPAAGDWIVVDDLDPGFRVEGDTSPSGPRLGGFTLQTNYDQGLPVYSFGPPPPVWSRWSASDCWGRYRRTLVLVRRGTGKSKAVFPAELPNGGLWRLSLHLPDYKEAPLGSNWSRGEFELNLVDSQGSQAIRFDAKGGETGWNILGEFDVQLGEVEVQFLNKTNGSVVLADAIRWQPMDGAAAGGSK